MKVFISWAGPASQDIANRLNDWLPHVIHTIRPFYAPNMNKGVRWATELALELKETDVGILILTREALSSQWLMYEAGALSKQINSSRVFPILFALDPKALPGPLAQFQATPFELDQMLKLVHDLNNMQADPIPGKIIGDGFKKYWKPFEREVNRIIKDRMSSNQVGHIDEILQQVLLQHVALGSEIEKLTNQLQQLAADTRDLKPSLSEVSVLTSRVNELITVMGDKKPDTGLSLPSAQEPTAPSPRQPDAPLSLQPAEMEEH